MENDLLNIILSFAESLSGFSILVTAGTYLLGVFLIASALYKLKALGDARSMMSQQMDISGLLLKC
jgi:hypothetical protein